MLITVIRRDDTAEVQVDDDVPSLLPGKVSIGSHGYPQFWTGERMELLHRWVLGLRPGDSRLVDHRNRNKLDCRRRNLRVATHSVNSSNTTARGVSGAVGVYPTRSGRWIARGNRPNYGGAKHLGTFDTREEAALVAHAWRAANLPGYLGPEPPETAAFFATPPVRHDPADRCRCSYHQWLRQPAYDGPNPDDHYTED